MGFLDFLFGVRTTPEVTQDKFDELRKNFSQKHEEIKNSVEEKHKNALALISSYPTQVAAGVMGMALVATHNLPALAPKVVQAQEASAAASSNMVPSGDLAPGAFLIADVRSTLPKEVRELTPDEEQKIGEILSKDFDMKVTAELDGIRLNRSYGLIGAEQHLARYPGDTMESHFQSAEDSQKYYSSGMAPGLGAWGYFAPSASQMTQKDIDREKYYIAVQTFLAPGFHDNVGKYISFFKYRKMLVVNPENGRAMVVIIGDAGPGQSTGKHLGGSPEVMKYLDRKDGAQKGPVLYFFIDDPEDKIPLGPIEPK